MITKSLSELESVDEETGQINTIIETPRGSRNKMKYDPERDLFLLHKVLPAGSAFPHDFGFIPSTVAADGDPLDVLVLMDDPIYPGNLVRVRLIGAILAEQTEQGQTVRNDRLISVAGLCREYENLRELEDLDPSVVTQIEEFFVSYNQAQGRKFKPIGRADAKKARKLMDEAVNQFKTQKHDRKS